MSFGGVLIDQINPTDRFPGKSLLTGLLGNALGWDHADQARLSALQAGLRLAARWDAEPTRLIDYHTVDLGHDFLCNTGWTTRGKREDRNGASSTGTHQRYRHYWANGCATVAMGLAGADVPTLEQLEAALRAPRRPLFIGRKTCLPSAPLLLGRRQASSLRDALAAEPLAEIGPRHRPSRIEACWPLDDGGAAEQRQVYDLRDWHNNLHAGSERYAVGFLEVRP
jgi:CRISPR system Cascade subunit CasD